MKHVLALTYEPKIHDVRSGKCNQTIRPFAERKRSKGDLVMFHGWSGRPYRSKWNWRTPYWKITEVIPITIHQDTVILEPWIIDVEREMELEDMQELAVRDGFKNYKEMYQQFRKMYGKRLDDMVFQIIRWNPTDLNYNINQN